MPDQSSPPSSVVGRVALLLDVLGAASGRVGLSELARATGLPKPTVHRLAGELARHGLLERAGDGWMLGPQLFELGQRVPTRRRLRDVTMPLLEELALATGHTVHLAALSRDDVVYVERLSGREEVEVPSEVAGRMPLHCTATGKCLLAFAPAEVVGRVVQAGLDARTTATIVSEADLREELDAVRREGISVEREEFAAGFSSVAAPVFGMLGSPLGAIAVTSSTARLDEARIGPLVREAAAEATRRFGGRSPEDPPVR